MNLTAVGDPRVSRELALRVEARRLADLPPPREPLPRPEIPGRPPTTEEMASCKAAATLERKALDAGWVARATFARGPYIGSDGSMLDVADSVLLRFFWDGPLEAWAVWYRRKQAWSFESAWIAGTTTRLAAAELTHWLCSTQPKEKKNV